jgi:enoyl-CoA hydratase
MSDFKSVRIERPADDVAELVLTGSGHGNALGPDFWREFPTAVAELNADAGVRCVILRGEAEHFSYGLDLQNMVGEVGPLLEDGAAGRAAIVELAGRMVEGFDALAAGRVPVIAAVDGWCIGAGVELIAAADIRICTRAARFALKEVQVGMVPDLGGASRLPYLVGEGRAREMALTGEAIDADTAAGIGLVNHVLDDADALHDKAMAIASRIAANPPLVVAGIRQVMNARLARSVPDGNREAATLNGMLMQSEDFAEAMRAFMEKRPPEFKGR